MIALQLYDPHPSSTPQLGLRGYYEKHILPEIQDQQTTSSLLSDRVALKHWERITSDPPLTQINQNHLASFRDGLLAKDLSPATVNKYWRELRSIFNWAADEDYIPKAPSISRRSKSKLVVELPKVQRETLSIEEVTRLFKACRKATYPAGGELPAPKLWRTAIVLWWFYGARTMDILKHLQWGNVHWNDRLLKFTAQKTGKLQGLPLTDLVIAHLQSVKRNSKHIFSGFRTPGYFRKETGDWKRGFYTTWRHEIQPAASLSEIDIKHFRETMVTRNNGIEAGLGNWIAGHYMPGVSAQSYDLPTQRIRDAIERTPVPDCFNEID